MSLTEDVANIWRIRDLRRKVLITIGLLSLCRVGVFVPMPGVNVHALAEYFKQATGTAAGGALGVLNLFAGGALAQGAIFGLGIMPYISASIIFTLLANVVPSLEALRKEGASGQRKLNQYTRITTVFICFIQGMLMIQILYRYPGIISPEILASRLQQMMFTLTSGFLLMVGTMFLMWLGEQIDEHGIGNGISLVITIGIVARMPPGLAELAQKVSGSESQQNAILTIAVLAILFFAVVVGIIYITRGERRIPVQQQKHVRGPKVYGGMKHYLPLRVNQAGVMPIIFAQSLLMLPALGFQALAGAPAGGAQTIWSRLLNRLSDALSGAGSLGLTYVVVYGALIFFFCYFWTALMFNPKEMSENLQNYGSFIPGIRPGKRTANYLEAIMNRVTIAGSFFLVVIALLPMLIGDALNVGRIARFYGGTTILIVVGVTLDVVRRINDHLEMRRYSGFAAGVGGRRRSRRR
jgi:preprotein translocase subunit SecY